MEPALSNFEFRVFNRRHNNEISYRVTKTERGWNIEHIAINGHCEPDGAPLFYDNFNQDNIQYPSGFGSFLEQLWSQLEREEIGVSEAQTKLQELAAWVSFCEQSQPQWKGWNV